MKVRSPSYHVMRGEERLIRVAIPIMEKISQEEGEAETS